MKYSRLNHWLERYYINKDKIKYLNQYDNNCYADDVLDMTAKSMDSI